LIGLGVLQFLIGNFVDPKIGGRMLSLSPFVILLAVVFWGWLWGSLGAVIAVPLVAAIVITCRQFESTRWIAMLLAAETSAVGDRGEQQRPRSEG
jgi:predicted PurR-regulated permease PerM